MSVPIAVCRATGNQAHDEHDPLDDRRDVHEAADDEGDYHADPYGPFSLDPFRRPLHEAKRAYGEH